MRTMGANDLANNSLIRGAPIRIFEAVRRSQKAVSPIPIFLKPSFYHVELFKLILQSVFLDIYSVPEFHFWKLRWLLWERILLIWGVEGDIFNIFFKNILLSHLNVWSSSAFLFLQSCSFCRKAYTQHKPDFTQESTTDPSVYHKHNIYPLFWFQIQTLLLKMLFHCDSFFFLFFYSNTIFIDMLKCKISNTLFNAFYFCIYF